MISLFATETIAKEWNGIVPCKSTRSDVEKMLGKDDSDPPTSFGFYKFKKDMVTVAYRNKA